MEFFTSKLVALINEKTTEILLNKALMYENLSACLENEYQKAVFEKCLDTRFFFHALYLANINEVIFLRYKLIYDLVRTGINKTDAKAITDAFVKAAAIRRGADILGSLPEQDADMYESLAEAVVSYDNGFYKKALTVLSHLSSSNFSEAHFYLGKCYNEGKAIKRNVAKALQCFTKGIMAGSSGSMYHLGLCLLKGDGVPRNPTEGLKLLLKAADMGQEEAVYAVGYMYKDGSSGFPMDIKKAIALLQKSADYGNWSAAISVCELYYEDAKTTGDFRKTSIARERVQNVKDPGACFKIAQIYERGIGVAPNIEKALNFSAKAAAKNYPGATEMMTRLGNQKLGR